MSTPEEIASTQQEADRLSSAQKAIEGPVTFANSLNSAVIPFYKYLTSKALGAALPGADGHDIARTLETEESRNRLASGLGTVAGIGASIPLMGGISGLGSGLGLGGRLAAQAGVGAALGATYGTGEALQHQLAEATPLDTEQLMAHIGLPTLLGAGFGAAGEFLSSALQGTRALGIGKARSALQLPKDEYGSQLAERALDEGLLTPGTRSGHIAEAEQAKLAVGKGMEDSINASTAKVPEGLQDELVAHSYLYPNVPSLKGVRNKIMNVAEILDKPDLTTKDIYDNVKALRDSATQAYHARRTQAGEMYSKAAQSLRGAVETAVPGYKEASKEYAYFAKVLPGAENAAEKGTFNGGNLGFIGGVADMAGIPAPKFMGLTGKLPGLRQSAQASLLYKMGNAPDTFLGKAMGALFGGTEKVAQRFSIDDYEDVINQIDAATSDPQTFQSNMSDTFSMLPPHVGGPMQARVTQAVDFLNQSRPKNPNQPLAHDMPWEPNHQQKGQFMEIVNAVHDPRSVMANPTPEGMAAVAAVYPEVMQKVNTHVLDKLAKSENLPYDVKLRVSKLLGMPLDGTQTPDFGNRMQQRMQAYRQKQENGQRGSARTAAAIRKADKAAMTRAQAIENEGN